MWGISELVAMATDLAEFLGAALGFYLLFHIPLFVAALLARAVTLLILALERRGVLPASAGPLGLRPFFLAAFHGADHLEGLDPVRGAALRGVHALARGLA